MPYKDKVFDAFRRHRMESRNRGIAFRFTFETWVAWWETHAGPEWLSKRGTQAHQLVMARKGDKGAYEQSNVECITAAQNMSDSWLNVERHTGGPHFAGMKHKPETIELMQRKHGGENNPFYGKMHSAETRRKMSESHRRRFGKL